MKIELFKDDTIELNLNDIVKSLNIIFKDIEFIKGKGNCRIPDKVISFPNSYKKLSKKILINSFNVELLICASKKRYDNNYFYETSTNVFIVSFHGWEYLTDVNINNGFVYVVVSILCTFINLGVPHDEITGCINDLLWDKTGIDVGLKAGLVCEECKNEFNNKKRSSKNRRIYDSIVNVLSDISKASKSNKNINEYWEYSLKSRKFHVFLCHNSDDKDEIRVLNNYLINHGIITWLDEDQIRPGLPWQRELEKNIKDIKTAAVFVGENGIGPWEKVEIYAFIEEFVRRACPVMPVILKSVGNKSIPDLPLLLRQFMWIDFRKNKPDPFKQLLWGITGEKK